ncbi:MAG: LuxR C-terminal-related transcriptional regulator [Gemmatimonadales bacterium]
MALTLSSADLARYRDSIAALLSPLDAPGVDRWRARSIECVKKLSGADKGVFMLPLAGHELIQSDSEETATGAQAYAEHYHRFDVGLQVRRKELGLQIFNCDMIYDPVELPRTTIHNEWAIPYRLLDPLAMGFEVHGGLGLASLHLYHRTPADRPFGETGLALLSLMLPAFKAGVLTVLRLERHRAELARTIDTLGLGIRLANITGGVIHQNPALGEMLADDPEREKLQAAIQLVARDVAGHAPPGSGTAHPASEPRFLLQVKTVRARYRVRGCLSGGALFHDRIVAMVMVDRVATGHPSASSLHERHGLTPREARVACLIADGMATADIGTALGISRHTVRRHSERILRKLGVHGRAAVRAKLWEPAV